MIKGYCVCASLVAAFAAWMILVPETRDAVAYRGFPRYGGHRGDYDDGTGCEFGSVVVTIPKRSMRGEVNMAGAGDLVIVALRQLTMMQMIFELL